MSEKILNIGNQKTSPQSGIEVIGSAQEDTKNKAKQAIEGKNFGSEKRVVRRVYFVRHGESVEDEKNKGLEIKPPQPPKTKLSETGRNQIQNTAKILQEMGLRKEDTLFIYADDTTRVEESLEILLDDFGISGVINDHKLKTSPKDIDENTGEIKSFVGIDRVLNDFGVSIETIKLMKEILKDKKYEEYKHIVLVGHKSNKPGINETVLNKNESPGKTGDFKIGNGEIIEADIAEDRQYLNYQEKRVLQITSKNYQKLKEIFPQIEAKDVIDFQNELNEKFVQNTELFKEYFFSDCEDLRVFCLVNLLSDKENQDNIKKVVAYYNQAKTITKEEENILILNLDIIKIKKLYVNLSLKKKITSTENIESLSKIFQIQYRSLDIQIKKQDEKGILKRELHRITKNTNVTTGEVRYSYHDIDIDYILRNVGQKFVLPAYVGTGKSICLSEFAKKVILDHPEYSVYFFEGKDFNHQYDENSITEKFEELLANTDYSKIIYIDAIDEIIDIKIKNTILEMIQNSKNKIIISGRLSDFQEKYNEGFITLGLQNLSKEKFIEEKIEDNEKGKRILDFLEQSNLSQEVEGNPLLLNFVCILANLDDEKKQEYIKIGIKELRKINNKADLYDSITRLVIFEHNFSKGHIIGKKELENSLNDLSKKAFDVFGGVLIDNEFDHSDLQKLSILFKKSGTGEYEFIHHSFYEFFLARYLSSNNNGSQEIYDYRDEKISSGDWDSWKLFQPVVLFYGEIIGNNNDTQKIIDLLSKNGILMHDDIFSENFFLALNIFSQLPDYIKKLSEFQTILDLYKSKVEKWDISEIMVKRVDYIKKLFDCIGDSSNIIGDIVVGKILSFLDEKESEFASKISIISTLSEDEIGYTINKYEEFQDSIILFSKILNPLLMEKIFEYMKKYEKYINYIDIYKIYSGILKTNNKKIRDLILKGLYLYKEFVLSSKEQSHRIMSMYVLFLSINPYDKEALEYLTTHLKQYDPFLMKGDIFIENLLKINISKESELYNILNTDRKIEFINMQRDLGTGKKIHVLSREEILSKIEIDFEIAKKNFLLSNTQDKDSKIRILQNVYSRCERVIRYGNLNFIKKTLLLIIEYYDKGHITILQRVINALGYVRNSYTKHYIIEWIIDSIQNANPKEKYVFYHFLLRLGNKFSKGEAAIWLLSNAKNDIKTSTNEFYYIYMVLLELGNIEFEIEARDWILLYIEKLFFGEKRNFPTICFEVLKIENIEMRRKIIPLLYKYSEQLKKNGNLKDAQDLYNKLGHLGIYISENGESN